ncbi:MAG TPA: C4-dicarboxylate ABC transporter permease [Aminobacterium sp.]|uniref:TRAP transporter large permease n=1 Tax=Aminobacterium TaxID=81466 RepID=UPI000EC1A449|nr:TRAP transporter large permease [Aminobacterium sp. UBA4834]HCA40453.1 C4-dicarboxylate ABC transporter permease [Aminobacterium sp.]
MHAILKDPALWSLILFVIPLLFRFPIAIALGGAALAVSWFWGLGYQMISYNFFAGIAKFPLLAIPFFILAGIIMEKAGIAERIIQLIKELVGSVTGGLAIATVGVATFWGAVSGSGPATVAAIGLILIPGMAIAGYDKAFAAAVVSVASGLAIVIPPSIAFIVYGVVTETSVSALFAAGVIPGIVVAIFMMIFVYFISKKHGYRGTPRGGKEALIRAFKESFWGLLTPIIILGGIYGGIFTPTEAAAVAVFYGLFVGVFVYKTITIKIMFEILSSTVISTAVVMIVVTCAGLYSWVGATVGLIDKAAALLLGLSDNPFIILLLINVILLFAGMILDAISIYYVFLPILVPIMAHFGWDPIWFGVIMTVNLAIGQVTPPVAVNLYVGANISNLTMEQISKPAFPLIFASILALLVLMLFPSLSTFLPKAFGLY